MALVNYGKEYGRLVVIVDVIDQNRVCSLVPFLSRGSKLSWLSYIGPSSMSCVLSP